MKVPIINERVTDDMTINNEPGYSPIVRTPSYSTIDNMDTSSMPPKFKDMSNGLLTNIIAVAIFVFVTGLNLFLIISMLMGVDVHL
jgi:metal iron transporter